MVLATVLGCTAPANAQDEARAQWAEQCADWDEWDKPGPPFKVHGDTYYVGTCGISAILIAGDKHVLIDSGTEAGAEIVLANIRKLGFDPADVRLILQSHEHHDHVGGMARIVEAAGVGIVANRATWLVYQTGEADPRDPQFGSNTAMTPVKVDFTVLPGGRVNLDAVEMHSVATPGHTPGALSWWWESCDGADCKTIVYADSLTPVSRDDYRFTDHPEYLAAFRASIAKVTALECDILLTPHPSASGMRDKLMAGDLSAGTTCRAYADALGKRLDTRLAEEAGGD